MSTAPTPTSASSGAGSEPPRVGIVMGSDSDWPVMRQAAEALAELGVAHESDVVSAHRMPEEMLAYGRDAAGRGLSVIVAGAGGAAHLPGMLAAVTPLPVIGVPVPLATLDGLDSLLSIVQMPAGVPVATVAIGGARNAGLLAVRILAATDPALQRRMTEFQEGLRRTAQEKGAAVRRRTTMKTLLALAALVVCSWVGLNLGGVAAARTLAEGRPMLEALDQAKVVACALAAAIGLVLVAWSVLPERRERVRVRIDDDR